MKTIAFIPARGGSQSIPRKNIKPLCGKPLIYWTVAALAGAAAIDEIIVATKFLLIPLNRRRNYAAPKPV